MVEVIQGDVIENVATVTTSASRPLVGKELAEQIGAVRRELAEGLSETRTAPMRAINRPAF